MARDFGVDRDRPDLAALARIENPHEFVWAVLPHAARTFSPCIALLPSRCALSAAVAYLFCRMLDTYEDLVEDLPAREAALMAFAARFDASTEKLSPAPSIEEASDRDQRDRAHLLLVGRSALVDRVFLGLDAATRGIVRDLVQDMAAGMVWSSGTFARQGGVLEGGAQLAAYCRHVLGNPVVFVVRLLRLHAGEPPELTPVEREHAMCVGEMIQLANTTRDVEKDLRRGVAYDATLRGDLCRDAAIDAAVARRCSAARARMLRIALGLAPSYTALLASMSLRGVSFARASAVLMLLFTERYFRSCAERCGLRSWNGARTTRGFLRKSLPALFSASYARRVVAHVQATFVVAARSSEATPSSA